MILYSAITITIFYYLVLWRVQSKKSKLECAVKEAFGAVTGIQELLDCNTVPLIANEQLDTNNTAKEIVTPNKEIFGSISNIKKLITTAMPLSTIPDIPPLSAIAELTAQPSSIENLDKTNKSPDSESVQEQDTQETIRHRIFSGSSLSKEETTTTSNNNNVTVKNKVTRLKAETLTKELEDIVEMLDEDFTEEIGTLSTTPLQVDNFSPSLENSNLVDQLNQLFKKDYQGYT